MPSPRLTLAALALALACAPKQPEPEPAERPEPPLPKPNIDPGRLPPRAGPAGGRLPEPDPYDTLQPVVAARGGVRARLDAARQHRRRTSSCGASDLRRPRACSSASSTPASIPGSPAWARPRPTRPKLLDLRDFSDEGAVPLRRVTPVGDTVEVAGRKLARIRPGGRAQHRRAPTTPALIARAPAGRAAGVRSERQRRRWATRSPWWSPARPTAGCSSPTPTATARSRASGRCTIICVARETFGWARGDGSRGSRMAANFAVAGRRARARSRLRQLRPRLPRRRHRGGQRPLRRRRVRRRGARRAAARPQDRQQRAGQHHHHRQHDARDGLRHPLRRGAPAAAGAEH